MNMTREELLKRVSALAPETVIDDAVISGLMEDDECVDIEPTGEFDTGYICREDCLERYIGKRHSVMRIPSAYVYIKLDDMANPQRVYEWEVKPLAMTHYYIRQTECLQFNAYDEASLFRRLDEYIKENGFVRTYILSVFEIVCKQPDSLSYSSCGFRVNMFGLTEKNVMVDMVEVENRHSEYETEEFLKMCENT